MVPSLELQIREGIHIIFFLFLYKNICCGYSLEAPRPGASHMYHKICFYGEISKILVLFFVGKCVFILRMPINCRWPSHHHLTFSPVIAVDIKLPYKISLPVNTLNPAADKVLIFFFKK